MEKYMRGSKFFNVIAVENHFTPLTFYLDFLSHVGSILALFHICPQLNLFFHRNRLKYALSMKEVETIMKQRLIKIDGKTRTDPKFPTGFMDVVQIEKTGENFRIIYDVKGRFTVHRFVSRSWSNSAALVMIILSICYLRSMKTFTKPDLFKKYLCTWFYLFHFTNPYPCRITASEAAYKLCKVRAMSTGPKGVPYIHTSDGRTIRYPDPNAKV